MREILFRGKRKDNGEWSYGDLSFHKDARAFIRSWYVSAYTATEIDPATVGQYTGLTDKNGVKIFEGDIITCSQYLGGNFVDYHIEKGYVEMKFGAFGLHRKQGYYRPFKDWLEDYEFEVTGNIHDNPELLSKEDTKC